MADFLTAYSITLKIEGGYSNNPKDRGGETYKGIARKIHPYWQGWAIVDAYKKKSGFPANLERCSELQNLKRSFYKTQFWDLLQLDMVNNQAIANELFDTAVNMSPGVASIFLQRVLNVSNQEGKYYADLLVDGKVGMVTLKALNKHPRQSNVLKMLNCLQGARYISICEANPSQETFLHGWMERVFENTGV